MICVARTAGVFLRSTNVISRESVMLKLPKRRGNLRVTGCLPFTCTNHLVHDVGKWFAKLRTDKFHPTIAFTICTNQFHLLKNGREGLKLVSKMALKEWNTNFRLEYSIQKNKTTFQMFPLLLEIFHWENPKSLVPFIFQPDFPENFCKW